MASTAPSRAGPAAIGTTEDLLRAIESDPDFRAYTVRTQGPGFVEIALETRAGAVLCWPEVWRDRSRLAPHLLRARCGYIPLVLLGSDDEFAAHSAALLRQEGDLALHVLPLGRDRLRILLANYQELCRLRREAAEGDLLSDRYRYELDELCAIGRAVSAERNIDQLLALVLEKARFVTGADAGSIYVVDDPEDGIAAESPTLRFKVSQNESVKLDFKERTLPVSEESIVGRCVIERQVINIPDLYRLDEPGEGNNPWGFRHNRAFDDRVGYQTHSMLAVPMIDAEEQVIGVVQLINRKRRPEAVLQHADDFAQWVVAFDARAEELAAAVASQAGVSLENALLYNDIRRLFEGFVRASVTAIESRDPTTSGHSQRVADLTVGLAKVTAAVDQGPYADFSVTYDQVKQIEYAALLHDFGKVGVRENVLVKAKKLYEPDRQLLLARFDYIRKAMEAEKSQAKLRYFLELSRDEALVRAGQVDAELEARLIEIDDYIAFVLKANEPTVLASGGFEKLIEIAAQKFSDARGQETAYLLPHELETLQVPRGSLTKKERLEIESHVSHTYNFLRRIPWGRAFKDIPLIAGAHHEKLDGTGYPRGLHAAAIPAPARMMTIADIYDALTASDRPYKKAVPAEKALDILATEVKQGKCDPELFRLFVDAKIWHTVLPK
jgi:HD-GYP domain-containing protein (c-di-GMP phosphodiesterase class II)